MKMTTVPKIKEAESRLDAARKVLRREHDILDDLYRQRSKELFGIEPGLRVRRNGHEYLVTEVRPEAFSNHHKPWLYGKKIKKNGQPGSGTVTIYGDWEIVGSAT